MNHYKAEHQRLLNEATTLPMSVREGVRTTRGSVKRARRELCVTSGASIVIKNVSKSTSDLQTQLQVQEMKASGSSAYISPSALALAMFVSLALVSGATCY